MTKTPTIQIDSVLKRFGGPNGLHARLVRSPYVDGTFSSTSVRVWKTRGQLPAQMVLPVMLLLRDAGEDPFDFVDEPKPLDPFEGLS